jgi:hypothetical protein
MVVHPPLGMAQTDHLVRVPAVLTVWMQAASYSMCPGEAGVIAIHVRAV